MKKLITLLLVLVGIQFIPNKAHADGVAVIDLDAVAKDLGVLDYIANTLANKRFDLSKTLSSTQQSLQGQFNKALADAGKNPSEDAKKKLITTNQELQTQFRKQEVQVNQEFQILRQKLINDFRNELKPIALDVAKKKKLDVILNTVMPPVYAFGPAADITKDVTAAAKKAGLTKTPPALKK